MSYRKVITEYIHRFAFSYKSLKMSHKLFQVYSSKIIIVIIVFFILHTWNWRWFDLLRTWLLSNIEKHVQFSLVDFLLTSWLVKNCVFIIPSSVHCNVSKTDSYLQTIWVNLHSNVIISKWGVITSELFSFNVWQLPVNIQRS